jgi:ribA/ribD-fused uncharacterized protein
MKCPKCKSADVRKATVHWQCLTCDNEWYVPSVIDRFDGAYAFLSNFHPCQVRLYGIWYPSVEHAFQAAKAIDPDEREQIRLASTPGRAKRLGRRVVLRPDWEDVKIDLMTILLRRKFEPGSDLWDKLKATSPAELIEGNTWGDTFWGAVPFAQQYIDHRWIGQNQLGKLLVKIRDEEIG